jgi:DNA-binding transcriptional ArsR family regulator
MSDPENAQAVPEGNSKETVQEAYRLLQEQSRLKIMHVLNSVEEVSFKFLETITKIRQANLSTQTAKLEEAGYLTVHKYLNGKYPETWFRITPEGKAALAAYLEYVLTLGQNISEEIAKHPQRQQPTSDRTQILPKTAPGTA